MDEIKPPTAFVKESTETDALGNLEVGFLRDNEEWVEAYRTVQWGDINSLDNLVRSTEQLVLKYKNPNALIKSAIQKVFEEILSRYPLLFGYWKKYTAVQYQINGLERSLEVLSSAVDAFPHSLELWCDYLNVLLANSPDKIDHIRTNFLLAKDQVGYQFLSHPFWDMYIKFEIGQQQWQYVAQIYQTINKIPLHQYAKYYSAFKTFLIEHPELVNSENVDEIFATTQQAVNEIWTYESQVKQNFFNLSTVNQKELDNWDKYLKAVTLEPKFSNEFVQSVFERCLIPCQYYEYFWLEYSSWMKNAQNFEGMITLFQRGIQALPIDMKKFRYAYLQFLKSSLRKHRDVAGSLFFSALTTYSNYWPQETDLMVEYLAMTKRLNFPSKISQEDKEILKQQTAYAAFLEDNINNYLKKTSSGDHRLLGILNDRNISVVIVELIKITYLTLKNNIKTNKYFIMFGSLPQMKDSVPFWLIYYKFLKVSVNYSDLDMFIMKLGKEIFLPIAITNDIISDYKSFYMTNASFKAYEHSVSENHARMTFDPLIEIDFKINDPQWGNHTSGHIQTEWHKSISYKENGHVGISIEKPAIANTIMQNNSKSFGTRPPPLPTFRNLEKINKPVVYIDYFSQQYTSPK